MEYQLIVYSWLTIDSWYGVLADGAQYHGEYLPTGVDQMKDFLLQSTYTDSETHCAWLCHNTADCGSFVFLEKDCNRYSTTSEYHGKVSTTINGRQCQSWNNSVPWHHNYNQDSYFPDGSVEKARNFCRDPGDNGYLWCYTTDPGTRWEPCDIPFCDNDYEHLKEICTPQNHNSYIGQVNVASGLACQRWDSQSPHSHTATDPTRYPDGSLTAAENYCRDPDGTGVLWCYTMEPGRRWLPCNVPVCENVIKKDACYPDTVKTYTGNWGWTITGNKCQTWSTNSPHAHNYTEAHFPDDTVTEAGNFCRDPSSEGYLWCYTNDPGVKWEPCGMPRCKPHADCRQTGVSKYIGTWNTTLNGQPCIPWSDMTTTVDSSMFPNDNGINSVANYCRDPASSGSLMGYTHASPPETGHCDLIPCHESGSRCRMYSNALTGSENYNRDGLKFFRRQ